MGEGQANGTGSGLPAKADVGDAPREVTELAEACVKFVARAVNVELDYQPETLSVLDHYLATSRREAQGKLDVLAVVAHTAGAYFGEVIRRRHASWWRVEGNDPNAWRIELEEVYLSVSPVGIAVDALGLADRDAEGAADLGALEFEDEDRDAVRDRLADLPEVSEDEFYAPSTRLEVIDIAIEAIRARRIGAGVAANASLTPRDYDD